MSWWNFWSKPVEKASNPDDDDMPPMREDGFMLMDLPEDAIRQQPAYLTGVEQEVKIDREPSSYTAVDHDALARANEERSREKTLWEKLRSGEPLSSGDVPLHGGFFARFSLRVMHLLVEPFAFVANNVGMMMSMVLIIGILALVTFALGEWTRSMLGGLN